MRSIQQYFPFERVSEQTMCGFCFDTVYSYLTKVALPAYPLQDFEAPLFVSWHGHGNQLRGCIGTFQADKMSKILSRYAIISSQKDDRFQPMSLEQLRNMEVTVSVLGNFTKRGNNIFDWEVGKHGIIINVEDNGESYDGTYLPEVMVEQKWTKEQALLSLLRKAGYRKKNGLQHLGSKIQLTTYEASIKKQHFRDWWVTKDSQSK